MKRLKSTRVLYAGAVLTVTAVLAACASQPVAPPPPKPVAVVIPPRPYPPMGASPNFVTPPVDANGVRHTVNVGLSSEETVWNLRSAYNVAALNCTKPEHAAILAGYGAFLKNNSRTLSSINRKLDRDYRAEHGSKYIHARERFQTQVYNYFAFPPTLPAFCDAVLAMSRQVQAAPPKDLNAFAAAELPQLDSVFGEFFNSYDQYRSDLAAWEARYGAGPITRADTPQIQGRIQGMPQ